MPAKITKQQKKGKNNKRHSNKNWNPNTNQKKKTQNDKSPKLKKTKIANGHHSNSQLPSTQNHVHNGMNGVNGINGVNGVNGADHHHTDRTHNNHDKLDKGDQDTETETTNKDRDKDMERKKAKETIELLQRRRLHGCYLGDEFMSKHNFEMARVYFEQSLNRNIIANTSKTPKTQKTQTTHTNEDNKDKDNHNDNDKDKDKDEDVVDDDNDNKHKTPLLPELPNELDIYCKLLICRMHCDNSNTNLSKALNEVNYILSKIPNSVQHHIMKAELNIRSNNFDEVGSCLLKAAQMDQPDILDSVHLYFHQIAQNTNNDGNNDEDDIHVLPPNHNQDIDIDIDKLCRFFDEMTLISQQNILSLEWQQIMDAIHSSLCDDIIDPLFTDNDKKQRFKLFLQKTLEWNLAQNEKQQSLIFLKVEFAYILARTLWDKFKLPPKPNEETTKCMEDAIAIDCKPTYFLENGLFGCRDGYDFVSAAIFEPSMCLSAIFDIINDNKLIINHSWLYESGIKLIDWLSNTPLYHISDIKNPESEGSKCSDDEWKQFMQTRINAHYAIDPELNETVLSRDAHEDGKKFEDAMEKIVGKEKKNHLMQLELDLSIPILKKYANIMSQISGIDQDVLIYELTLPDDEDMNNDDDDDDAKQPTLTSSLLSEYLNNPKFKDYKPVGLPVLVQNAEFNIVPSSSSDAASTYDRQSILSQLSLLEKEVVQFQIDYKNQVYKVAGDKATELDKVMSTLQYRGLELTKWLRNFVKYMIARRDIEQEIVDVSHKNNHKDAMNWFESMTNYLNGSNNILLKIISKLFIQNLSNSYRKYNHRQNNNNNNHDGDGDGDNEQKYEKYEIYTGKKIEKLSSRYFELDCMVKFYVSIKKQFEATMMNEKYETMEELESFINEKLLMDPEIVSTKQMLLSSLNMANIKIPILEIAIPATIIENQYGQTYKSWIRYPLTQTYVEKTKLFIERCKYLRDNILCFIYSSVEKRCLLYPTLQTSPNKYYKCIGCQKIYAQLLCKNCNLAHYCSIQCQHQHWDKYHKRECKKYANLSSPTKCIVFK